MMAELLALKAQLEGQQKKTEETTATEVVEEKIEAEEAKDETETEG